MRGLYPPCVFSLIDAHKEYSDLFERSGTANKQLDCALEVADPTRGVGLKCQTILNQEEPQKFMSAVKIRLEAMSKTFFVK